MDNVESQMETEDVKIGLFSIKFKTFLTFRLQDPTQWTPRKGGYEGGVGPSLIFLPNVEVVWEKRIFFSSKLLVTPNINSLTADSTVKLAYLYDIHYLLNNI